MPTVKIEGRTVFFERRGKGPPLLLVHGFPLDHGSWDVLAGELEHFFDLIIPDLPGFGLSEALAGECTIEKIAVSLAALLADLGFEKTFIAGHSMGGYIALAFAHKYPGQVLGLGLVSSQAAADSPERQAGRLGTAALVAQNGVGSVAGMAEKLSSNPALVPVFEKMIMRQNPEGVKAALKAMAARPDATGYLPGLKSIPVALVHGASDGLITAERAYEIKKEIPHAFLAILPGVGHSPMLEASDKTAQAIKMLLTNSTSLR